MIPAVAGTMVMSRLGLSREDGKAATVQDIACPSLTDEGFILCLLTKTFVHTKRWMGERIDCQAIDHYREPMPYTGLCADMARQSAIRARATATRLSKTD